jgi:tetratricopeptide (TPR) repeat protein
MKHPQSTILVFLRWLFLACSLSVSPVYADDYAEVNQLVRGGKLSEALKKADQFLAGKPRDPQMRFIKGVIQRDSGQQAEAISIFTKLTEDYPELPEPYNNLAVLYAGQNQFDKARAALEMAIRTNPSYSTAHENLGDVYAKLASQAYNKALLLDGSNTAVQPKLALIRELFNPNLSTNSTASATAKGQRPVAVVAAQTAPATTPVPPPTPAAPASPPKPSPAAVATPQATPVAPAALSAPAPATTVAPATAPASATAAPAAKPPSTEALEKDVNAALQAWALAWASKDMKGYLGAYAKEFETPGKVPRSAWEAERRQRITSKKSISLKLENIAISVTGNTATAQFRQDYKADALSVSSRKRIDFIKSGDRWLIIKESTRN